VPMSLRTSPPSLAHLEYDKGLVGWEYYPLPPPSSSEVLTVPIQSKDISPPYRTSQSGRKLFAFQLLGQGYFGDVFMGTLSLPVGILPVAVKMAKTNTRAINEAEREEMLRLQRNALRDELYIFAHIQAKPGGHKNVLKLVGAITTLKTDFCLMTEFCERGSMDNFLKNIYKENKFENELLDAKESSQMWKVLYRFPLALG
jgi:serine/threonine protein kinase